MLAMNTVQLLKYLCLQNKKKIDHSSVFSIPFESLDFPVVAMTGLDEQQLDKNAKAKFITTIAEAIYKVTNYATREEYEHAVSRVIAKWKFLDKQFGHVSYYVSGCGIYLMQNIL